MAIRSKSTNRAELLETRTLLVANLLLDQFTAIKPAADVALDQPLVALNQVAANGLPAEQPDWFREMFIFDANQRVGVRITSDDVRSIISGLDTLGLQVTGSYPELHFIEGFMPIDQLDELQALSTVVDLHASNIWAPITNAGSALSQADFVLEADRVRLTSPGGVDGTGVSVAVLSDSYNNLNGAATGVTNGDLPSGVTVLQDLSSGGTDEGRAMLELIHDVAPGASLAFATAFTGEAGFAGNITTLATTNDVIVDDVTYFSEPFFQDGIVAQAVDAAVANGTAYFSSAGNSADNAWETTSVSFSNQTITNLGTGDFLDFDPGAGVDVFQDITIPNGASFRPFLQWDDPFYTANGVDTDIDFFLLDSGGNVVRISVADSIGDQLPYEGFSTLTNSSGSSATYRLVIQNYAGPDPTRMRYVDYGRSTLTYEYDTHSTTLSQHSAAAGGVSVAAAAYFNQTNAESFTSVGPVTIVFNPDGSRKAADEVRQKPDLTAIDGTDTSFFGGDADGNGKPNFFGTSAAAPHAAAVAALMIQKTPSITPAQIKSTLMSTAFDIGAAGFDTVTGAGLINAYDAVFGAAQPATVPFSDNFESGYLSSAYETHSFVDGRIQVTTANSPAQGSQHVTLGNQVSGSSSLNELILHLDATNRAGVTLSFTQRENNDSDNAMSASFTGHENSDGVAFSVDGTTWYRIVSLTGLNSTNSNQTQSFNLSTLAATAGVTLGSDVRVKFQQYGTAPFGSNEGMAFDSISVTAAAGITVTESGGSTSVSESGTTDSFDVVLTVQPTSNVVLTVTSGDTTEATVAPTTLTFTTSNWNVAQTVTVTGVTDTLDDGDKTSSITIAVDDANSDDAFDMLADQTVSVLTTDIDPAPSVTLELTGDPLAENGGVATVTARLSYPSESSITVTLAFGGTATNVSDYTRSATQIVIAAGQTTGSITLTGVTDALDELDETITVDISGVTNGTESGTQQVTATITDDDPAPGVTLSLSGSPLAEFNTTATITATLDAVSELDVTIDLAFTGTATVVSDYNRSATQIVIPAGQTTGTVDLTSNDDNLDETDETIIVDIVGVTNGTETGTQQVTATITDDDAPPNVSLSLTDSPLAENFGVAIVTATLTVASGRDVTVNLGFTGTAIFDTDYSTTAAQIVIPAGSTEASISLIGSNDSVDENDETIIVDITSVTNGTEAGTQQVTAVIIDDDSAPNVSLSLSGSPLAENGGKATVTATLQAASDLDVTVTLGFTGSATNISDYTRSGTQISIPAGSLTGSITLTGVDDALDEDNETIVVDITAATNATEVGTEQVTATITDDDPLPGVTLSLTNSPLAENGGVATITATLDAVSGRAVTVDLGFTGSATNSSDYTRSAAQIVIPAGSTTGTVTLTGVNDSIDEADETIVVDISAVTNGTETGSQQVTATITDDDVAGFTIVESSGSTSVSESGTTDSFSVVLNTQPTSNVVLTIVSADTGEATVSASTLTFTSSNWNTPQIVTVTGVDDPTVDGNQTTLVTVSVDDSNSDDVYDPLADQTVSVTTLDNDTGSFTITQSGGSTSVNESGSTDSFTVVLDRQPLTDVVLTVTASDTGEATVDVATLTFTSSNWNVAQSVTVTGVDDLNDDGDIGSTITLAVDDALSDAAFDPVADQIVNVTTVDNDTAGFTIVESSGTTAVTEAGSMDSFTVVLTAAPIGTVTLTVTAGDTSEATASPTTLTFTSSDWNTPQTVTITGVDDVLVDGNVTSQISIAVDAANSSDEFDAVSSQAVTATTSDDDVANFGIVETSNQTSVTEAGSTDSFTVTLSAAPVSDVVISVTSGDTGEAAVSPTTLTFNASNWNVPQTVTVTGVNDFIIDGTQTTTITVSINDALSNDFFDAVADQTVSVSTTDNDVAGFVVNQTSGTTVVTEGGTSDTFTVVLTAQPTSNVVFTVTGSNSSEATVAPTVLTFLPGTWNVPQIVTITGVDDLLIDGPRQSTVTIAVDASLSDNDFDMVANQTVNVTTFDDDSPRLTVTQSGGSTIVSEAGTTDTFTVALARTPAGDVIVNVTRSATDEVSLDIATLTFTTANWDQPQTVTVTGLNDFIIDGSQLTTIVVSVDDALSHPVYAAAPDVSFQVQTTDDDVAGVLVTQSGNSTSVAETGTTDTLTAVLTAQPNSNVVITVAASDATEASVSPATLTFTTLNWSVPQTITVRGIDDVLIDGTQTSTLNIAIDATLSDDNFDAVASQTVSVTTLDDTAPIVTVPGTQNVGEDTPVVFGTSNSLAITTSAASLVGLNVRVTATNGSLTLGTVPGDVSVTTTNSRNILLSGSSTSINTALDGLRLTPPTDFSGSITVSISAEDQRYSGGGAEGLLDQKTVLVNYAAVNDPPVITGPVTTLSVNEDTTLSLGGQTGNALSVRDVDLGSGVLRVSLSAGHGTLSVGSTSGMSFDVGDGTNDAQMEFLASSTTALNAALDRLVYQPTADFNGNDSIVLTVNDMGNNGAGGPGITTFTVSLSITAINDDPTVSVPTASQSLNEDGSLVFSTTNGNALSVSDVDVVGTSNVMRVGLSVQHGQIELASGSSVSVVSGVNSSAGFVMEGTLSQLNAALNGLRYRPNLDYSGNDVLSLTAQDLGNTGSGGAKTTTSTVNLTVAAINDAPQINLPNVALSTDEDQPLAFTSSKTISVADVDAGSQPVRVSLSVLDGRLTLGATNGLTFITGDGTSDISIVFEATLLNANTALASLSYEPTLDFNGSTQGTIAIDDLGNSGQGTALASSANFTINVVAVNDAPTGNPESYRVAQGGVLTASDAIGVDFNSNNNGVLINDSDIEHSSLTAVLLTPPAHHVGNFTLNSNGTFSYRHDGTAIATDSFTYAAFDGVAQSAPATVTINVDLSLVITSGQSVSVTLPENSAASTQVSDVDAMSPTGGAVTYAITAGNTNNAFEINSATGVIRVADSSALNFESQANFTLTVLASSTLSATATITVNLSDVAEAVTLGPSLWENGALTLSINNGVLRVTDANSAPIGEQHVLANVTNLTVVGRNGSPDVLTLDTTNGLPLPNSGLSFDGGFGGGDDSLRLVGSQAQTSSTITVVGAAQSQLALTANSRTTTISSTGVEEVSDGLNAATRSVVYGSSNDSITVSESNGIRLVSPFVALNVAPPTSALTVSLGAGNDVLTVNSFPTSAAFALSFFGEAGQDNVSLSGLQNGAFVDGGSDDDILNGGQGPDTLSGADGNDSLDGRAGNDVLRGGAGRDTLTGGAGANSLNGGGASTDLLREIVSGVSTITSTRITSALGSDDFVAIESLEINGAATNDTIDLSGWTLASDPTVFGGAGDDTINGSAIRDFIDGQAGNDNIIGNDGNDALIGGDGNDRLTGNAGNDVLNGGDGDDTLLGGAGNDQLTGGNGFNLLNGQGATDLIREFVFSFAMLTPTQLISSTASNSLLGIEQAILVGSDSPEMIDARTFAGTTTIAGAGGNDTIWGGLGFDQISAGAGDDIVLGYGSTDIIFGDDGNDTIDGGDGNDNLNGGAGDDVIRGGAGNDRISGGLGNDTLLGGVGNDSMFGQEGADVLLGEGGDDQITGDIAGNSNRDTIAGGGNGNSRSTGDVLNTDVLDLINEAFRFTWPLTV